MKRLLKHAVPLAVLIGCGNQKVTLYFKHLLQIYPDIFAADAILFFTMLLFFFKFFHYWPLETNFFKNAVTRWMAHDLACRNLCDGFKQIVSTLTTCVSKRKEPDALGIFLKIASPRFLATILMLHDVFAGVQPLNLVLQKSGESLILADIPVYLDKTMSFLEKLKSANRTKDHSSQNQIPTNCLIFPKKQLHHFHQVLALCQISNYLNGNNLKQMSTCHSYMYLRKKLRQHFHSLISGWNSTY